MVSDESDLGRYSYVVKLWKNMQNCATMQPMLINSSYTFRFMSYAEAIRYAAVQPALVWAVLGSLRNGR